MSNGSILRGARIYLSGPMDFVVSRQEDKQIGWRSRLRHFLKQFDAIVYDPWSKPIIVGQNQYGKNYEYSTEARIRWTFDNTEEGRKTRAELCAEFYPTVHINRRMVDICDFLIAYCPTNVYSVGTVNEIVRARAQNKPVLLVSPPVEYFSFDQLKERLKNNDDQESLILLEKLEKEAFLKSNPEGIPSPWYLGIMPEDYLFDGFGFHLYPQMKNDHNWPRTNLDEIEERKAPKQPLLPYLEKLNKKIPKRYDLVHKDYVENPDWVILQPGIHNAVG